MRTLGNPQEMSSSRAEHVGIITLLLYLQYFQTRFAHLSSTITIYIDSQAVLDRLDSKPTFARKLQPLPRRGVNDQLFDIPVVKLVIFREALLKLSVFCCSFAAHLRASLVLKAKLNA